MPIVELTLIAGYTPQDKTRLCAGLTDALRCVIPAPAEAVTVVIRETPATDYMRGRHHRAPAPALPDPVVLVRRYLTLMEARDLDGAEALLAPGFSMTFPGGVTMTRLTELVAWARPRYRFVTKSYAGFELAPSEAGPVVWCHGTLAGEWPDGTAFGGVRFVDRFALSGGLILRQDVWNDLGEVRGG